MGWGAGLELSIKTVLGTRADHSVVFSKWAELQMSFRQEAVTCWLPPKRGQVGKERNPQRSSLQKTKNQKKVLFVTFLW